MAKKLAGLESAEFTKTTEGENGQDGVTTTTTISGDGVTTDGKVAVARDGKDGEDGQDGKNAVELSKDKDDAGHIVLNGKDGMTRIVYNDGTTDHEVATMDDGLK